MTPGPDDERRLDDRLTGLARVTAELIQATNADAVTKIIVEHIARAVGATIASLSLRSGPDMVHLMGLRGGLDGDAEAFGSYPLSMSTPTTEAIRSGRRLMLLGRAEILAAFPDTPASIAESAPCPSCPSTPRRTPWGRSAVIPRSTQVRAR